VGPSANKSKPTSVNGNFRTDMVDLSHHSVFKNVSFRADLTLETSLFWDIYVGLFYAVLFLCFVGFPVVFQEMRGWAPGIAGLGYIGIGVGVTLAVLAEPLFRILIAKYPRDPITDQIPPEAYVGPVCIGGILVPIGQFWFAWTARESIHWIVPILGSVPFGFGNCLVFIYTMSYLAGSYGIYTASAVAGMSASRYIFSGVLPIAGVKMYHVLGVNWTGTLLGCLEILLIPIPFVFYRYGERIRRRSPLISRLA